MRLDKLLNSDLAASDIVRAAARVEVLGEEKMAEYLRICAAHRSARLDAENGGLFAAELLDAEWKLARLKEVLQ
jgi:hypothetical protein